MSCFSSWHLGQACVWNFSWCRKEWKENKQLNYWMQLGLRGLYWDCVQARQTNRRGQRMKYALMLPEAIWVWDLDVAVTGDTPWWHLVGVLVPWEQPSDPRYKSKANTCAHRNSLGQGWLWRKRFGNRLRTGRAWVNTFRRRVCKLEILSSERTHLVAKPAAQWGGFVTPH